MSDASGQFLTRQARRPAGAMAAVLLGVGAILLVEGCDPTTEAISRSVDKQLVAYQNRSDVPWGAIPVAPGDSGRVVTQIALQAGAIPWRRADESSQGAWTGSDYQGTGEVVLVADYFRFAVGGRYGVEPSGWASVGLIGRPRTGMNVVAEGALGLTKISHSVDLRVTDRSTTTFPDGSQKTTEDIYEQHSKQSESIQGFSRFTVGLLPARSGPWFLVQAIPSWTMAEWSGGFVDDDGTIHRKEERSETVFLWGLGAGWTQRFDNKTVSFGARYSPVELRQVEAVVQFSAEM